MKGNGKISRRCGLAAAGLTLFVFPAIAQNLDNLQPWPVTTQVQPGQVERQNQQSQGQRGSQDQPPQQSQPMNQNQPRQAQQGQKAPPDGSTLTLEQARQIAVTNHPLVHEAQYAAIEAHQLTTENRAAYYPTVAADLTGVESNDGRVAAGALNSPRLFNRFAGGASLQQLITDFGRTKNLVSSANLHAESADQNVNFTQEQVLLNLDRAYYGVLGAQAVLAAAQEAVKDRQVASDQIHALAQNNLRSQLDVDFVDVNLAQAKLTLLQAQNDEQSSYAVLSEALGLMDMRQYTLVDPGPPQGPPAPLDDTIASALRDRPDVAAQRLEEQSEQRFAVAERDLWLPDITLGGAAGDVPVAEAQFVPPLTWAALGFDVHIPVFNGKLFNARHAAAIAHAEQAAEQLRDLENTVSRDVRVAWLAANTAYQNLSVTQQLLNAAQQALDLANGRYKIGLSSIVELSQAQLNQEQAAIAEASAKYVYATRISELMYQEGVLK
jgi:outer membrane protein